MEDVGAGLLFYLHTNQTQVRMKSPVLLSFFLFWCQTKVCFLLIEINVHDWFCLVPASDCWFLLISIVKWVIWQGMGVSNCFSGMHACMMIGSGSATCRSGRDHDPTQWSCHQPSFCVLNPTAASNVEGSRSSSSSPHCKLHSHTTQVGNPKLQTLNRKPWTWWHP